MDSSKGQVDQKCRQQPGVSLGVLLHQIKPDANIAKMSRVELNLPFFANSTYVGELEAK